MTRTDYLETCKVRARVLLNAGDARGAVASMMRDMSAHPATVMSETGLVAQMADAVAEAGDMDAAREFVEGFR